MECEFCRKDIERGRYCPTCYAYLRKHPEGFPNTLPSKGELVINQRGEVQCHVCGLFFRKLGNHISQKHFLNINDYKDIMRGHTKKHYRRVVKKNLLKGGKKTRFKPGQEVEGRGKHIKCDE